MSDPVCRPFKWYYIVCHDVFDHGICHYEKNNRPGNLDAIEISGYMMVFVVYGALAKTFRDGGLLRVELLYDKYPESVKKTADVLLGIIALIYCYLLTRYSWELVMASYTSSLRSVSTYRVLLWIPQMLLVGGAVLLTLTVIEYEIKKLIGLFLRMQ